MFRAVVVAQLVDQSLPFPEVCSSNPVIDKNLYWTVNCIEKSKIKKKRPGMAHLKKLRWSSILVGLRSAIYLNRIWPISRPAVRRYLHSPILPFLPIHHIKPILHILGMLHILHKLPIYIFSKLPIYLFSNSTYLPKLPILTIIFILPMDDPISSDTSPCKVS